MTRRDPARSGYPDLVLRDFKATAPDQLWVADITQHPTGEGWLYRPESLCLALVTDKLVCEFLNWIEKELCGISTRNQRLAGMHAFFRYLQAEVPDGLLMFQKILHIPAKRVFHQANVNLIYIRDFLGHVTSRQRRFMPELTRRSSERRWNSLAAS